MFESPILNSHHDKDIFFYLLLVISNHEAIGTVFMGTIVSEEIVSIMSVDYPE